MSKIKENVTDEKDLKRCLIQILIIIYNEKGGLVMN